VNVTPISALSGRGRKITPGNSVGANGIFGNSATNDDRVESEVLEGCLKDVGISGTETVECGRSIYHGNVLWNFVVPVLTSRFFFECLDKSVEVW
jgi:hypothetical protein